MLPEELYEKSSNVVARTVADKVVLLPVVERLGNEDYIYSLDDVGARIWELLDGKRTVGEVERLLVSEFDVPLDQLRSDLEEFISDLSAARLIKKID